MTDHMYLTCCGCGRQQFGCQCCTVPVPDERPEPIFITEPDDAYHMRDLPCPACGYETFVPNWGCHHCHSA